MSDEVWVLVIEHRHGNNTTVHRTYEGAMSKLHGFVEEWWEYEDLEGNIPGEPRDAIGRYFDVMGMDESYNMFQTKILD